MIKIVTSQKTKISNLHELQDDYQVTWYNLYKTIVALTEWS